MCRRGLFLSPIASTTHTLCTGDELRNEWLGTGNNRNTTLGARLQNLVDCPVSGSQRVFNEETDPGMATWMDGIGSVGLFPQQVADNVGDQFVFQGSALEGMSRVRPAHRVRKHSQKGMTPRETLSVGYCVVVSDR